MKFMAKTLRKDHDDEAGVSLVNEKKSILRKSTTKVQSPTVTDAKDKTDQSEKKSEEQTDKEVGNIIVYF